jgi:excisionase family DNA binding protein
MHEHSQLASAPETDSDARFLLSVEEAADRLSIGRTMMYALVKAGEINTVRLGRRRLVPVGAIKAYVNQIAAQQDAARADPHAS